jgi:hypothetical protein
MPIADMDHLIGAAVGRSPNFWKYELQAVDSFMR